MNYNMQGMMKTIPRALSDAEINEGRNQENHQVLMVDKTTSFKQKGKGKEREIQEEWQASCHSHE